LANPITYIDAHDPPFLLLHGDADQIVPHCQSEMLHTALLQAGVPSQYILVPGGKHVEGMMEDEYFEIMVGFFSLQSKNK
jgi:dipeptidyl aminopeptidase/acylaminoacyl peptidase